MRIFLPICANFFLLLSAFGFGGFLRPFFPASFSRIDRWAMLPLGGLGLQGVMLFLFGLIRFSPVVILGLLVPGALLGVRCLLQEARNANLFSVVTKIPLVPASVIAFVLAITILGGLAEPVGDIRMDAIAYHYLGPKVWLRQDVVRPVLDESHTSFPATVEIQYAPLLLLGGQRALEFFSVTALVLILLTAAATAIRCGLNMNDAWWTAAIISTMPALYRGLYGGLIDVIYAAFLIAAARSALDATCSNDYALAGLFCGFALGTKYTALIAFALLLFCVCVFPPDSMHRFSKASVKGLVLLCLVAALIAVPWYLRNWVVLGCPIYPPTPLLNRFFPVRYLSPEAIQQFQDLMHLTGRGLGHEPFNLLLLPLNLTFHTANFEGGAGGIGLVPLAFLPLCFRARSWDPFAKAFALFGFLSCLAWFYTHQESRYLIQVYVIAAIFGVAGWKHVIQVGSQLARALSILAVAVSVVYGLFMIFVAREDDMHASVSASFAQHRNQAEIPFLESFEYLNSAPSVGKVLVMDPLVPTFYLNKEYVKPLGRRGEKSLPGIITPREALNDLQELHITYVMDVQTEKAGFQVPDHPKNLFLVLQEKNQRIYRVSTQR